MAFAMLEPINLTTFSTMQTSKAGLDLIKEFEGLRLVSYPDPGTGGEPWTIGYGHTGKVRPGDRITKEKAEELLMVDVARFENCIARLVKVRLSQGEFDALISFCYNVGEGAFESSTLLRRLNAGEPRCTIYVEEMNRWVNGANGPMDGLKRRRKLESEMACNGAFVDVIDKQDEYMVRAAQYYKAEPHQKAAYRWLQANTPYDIFEGFKARYSGSQTIQEEPAPAPPKFPLDVPYFYQRDSRTGHGERMCFSSSMAMAIEYLDPEAIDGDDDTYLSRVFKYGDSVSAEAQVKAARSLGVPCKFRTNGSIKDLEQLLDEGIPVPIGILHKGSIQRPSGGGHWICLIGYDQKNFMVHDPFGELDLVNGGYPKAGSVDGKNQRYSKKNLMKRWLIANDHDGWLVEFQ